MNNSDLKKLSGDEPGEIDAPLKFFDSLFEGPRRSRTEPSSRSYWFRCFWVLSV